MRASAGAGKQAGFCKKDLLKNKIHQTVFLGGREYGNEYYRKTD